MIEAQTGPSLDQPHLGDRFARDLDDQGKWCSDVDSGPVTQVLDVVDLGGPGVAGTSLRATQVERHRGWADGEDHRTGDLGVGDVDRLTIDRDDTTCRHPQQQVRSSEIGGVLRLGPEPDVVGATHLGHLAVLEDVDLVGEEERLGGVVGDEETRSGELVKVVVEHPSQPCPGGHVERR